MHRPLPSIEIRMPACHTQERQRDGVQVHSACRDKGGEAHCGNDVPGGEARRLPCDDDEAAGARAKGSRCRRQWAVADCGRAGSTERARCEWSRAHHGRNAVVGAYSVERASYRAVFRVSNEANLPRAPDAMIGGLSCAARISFNEAGARTPLEPQAIRACPEATSKYCDHSSVPRASAVTTIMREPKSRAQPSSTSRMNSSASEK